MLTGSGRAGGTPMKWELDWNDPFTTYLAPFDHLVGDRRTWITLTETVRGIIGSGSLICQPIATQSPILSRVQKGAQRNHSYGHCSDDQALARTRCHPP